MKRDVRAYAWPLTLLRFATSAADDRSLVLVCDANGDLRILG